MKWSLRTRIVLWAFSTISLLLLVQALVFLNRFELSLYAMVDEGLREEFDELRAAVETPEFEDYLRVEMASDLFYEVRDERNGIVALSDNLHGRSLSRSSEGRLVRGVRFREEAHPLGRDGVQRIRVGEAAVGDYRIQIAATLRRVEATHAAMRNQALLMILLFGFFATGGAYLVARRALQPLKRLVHEAKQLSLASEGVLPEAGSGDEIDELAAVLNDLLTRVRAHVRRIGQFTADAAHELRTPLTAIRGHLEVLLGRLDSESQDVLGGVIEEVDRLGDLVNQLLLLEKLQSGEPHEVRKPVDLGQIARDLSEFLGVAADDGGIRLTCDADAGWVMGDPSQLRQLLFNLIDNALKFTPRGGEIRVSVRALGEQIQASVRDTGPGLSPRDAERIFDRFYSDRSRDDAGVGLGLAIARAIAATHGGNLVARPGRGAKFVLCLPSAGRGSTAQIGPRAVLSTG